VIASGVLMDVVVGWLVVDEAVVVVVGMTLPAVELPHAATVTIRVAMPAIAARRFTAESLFSRIAARAFSVGGRQVSG
jgi:hypothetical protein